MYGSAPIACTLMSQNSTWGEDSARRPDVGSHSPTSQQVFNLQHHTCFNSKPRLAVRVTLMKNCLCPPGRRHCSHRSRRRCNPWVDPKVCGCITPPDGADPGVALCPSACPSCSANGRRRSVSSRKWLETKSVNDRRVVLECAKSSCCFLIAGSSLIGEDVDW